MNGNPKKINVLYAKVEECGSQSGILQQVVDGVVDLFHSNGMKCFFLSSVLDLRDLHIFL